VILIRVKDRGPAKHAAIASGADTIILRVHGRMRVSPQTIWATNFREVVTTTTQTQGDEPILADEDCKQLREFPPKNTEVLRT